MPERIERTPSVEDSVEYVNPLYHRAQSNVARNTNPVETETSSKTWLVVPDPSSRFLDHNNPFFIDETQTIACALMGEVRSKAMYEKMTGYVYFTALVISGLFELVVGYAVTELLPDYLVFFSLLGVVLRVTWLLQLNTELLRILVREPEFLVLFFSICVGAIGLFDAFNYVNMKQRLMEKAL